MREMKDSGVAWIGEIPAEWSLIRFKDKWTNKKEIAGHSANGYERLALTLNGVIKREKDDTEGLQPKEFDGYQILRKNDFVFKMIDLQNISTSRVGLSSYIGLVSPAYIRFAPKNEMQYSKFTYYYLMSMYYNCVYNNLAGDGVRSALNASDMGRFYIPWPDYDIQKKVAEYIDVQIFTVNAIIANNEAQIEKLKAYKQSLITEVVTKGLDPSVPMKDSGVEWIGEIPEHWNAVPINALFRIKKEIIGHEPDCVLSITQQGLKVKDISVNEGQMAANYDKYQIVNIGDFAMNHMDLLTGGVGISEYEGVTSPDYRVFTLRNTDMNKRYFLYIFQIYYRNKIFYAFGQGAANMGRLRLPAQNFKTMYIPVAPDLEQSAIVSYLDTKCIQIDRLIAVKQAKIEKLNQYKKSLIYEYVTGKKEVQTNG